MSWRAEGVRRPAQSPAFSRTCNTQGGQGQGRANVHAHGNGLLSGFSNTSRSPEGSGHGTRWPRRLPPAGNCCRAPTHQLQRDPGRGASHLNQCKVLSKGHQHCLHSGVRHALDRVAEPVMGKGTDNKDGGSCSQCAQGRPPTNHTYTQVLNTWTNGSVKGVPQLPGHHPLRLKRLNKPAHAHAHALTRALTGMTDYRPQSSEKHKQPHEPHSPTSPT
jgi:hypothetical protein